MKKIFLLSIFLIMWIFVGTGFALPVLPAGSIYDSYLHPNDAQVSQQNLEVIGNPDIFNIYGHNWVDSQSLQIYLSWNVADDLYGKCLNAMLGDVFLYDPSGQNLDLFIPVRDHDSGYDGNTLSQGNIYQVGTTLLSNDYYSGWSTSRYGDNEIVTGADGSPTGESALVNWVEDEGGWGYNTIDIDFGNTDYDGRQIRFAYTCGNDVHAPVPEPATMLLLGSGLIGLAGFGRKKFFKK